MTKLRSLVERTGIALFLVSHLRRTNSDSNSHEEGGRVSLGQLKKDHSIAQLSDSVIALERDHQGEANANLTTLRVLKNRFSGEVGVATTLSLTYLHANSETKSEDTVEFNPTDFKPNPPTKQQIKRANSETDLLPSVRSGNNTSKSEDVELHCLVTLDYETGETTRYNDTGTAEPISRGVTYLMDADTIIGHNIIGFDADDKESLPIL